jgi:hypothetical protein
MAHTCHTKLWERLRSEGLGCKASQGKKVCETTSQQTKAKNGGTYLKSQGAALCFYLSIIYLSIYLSIIYLSSISE